MSLRRSTLACLIATALFAVVGCGAADDSRDTAGMRDEWRETYHRKAMSDPLFSKLIDEEQR